MGNSGNYRGDNNDTKLIGRDGVTEVDVVADGLGKNRLATDSVVTVISQLGFDDIADSWFAIGEFDDSTGVGAAGDTVRVQIAAGDDATRYPAVDVTYTITSGDVADARPELSVVSGTASALNSDNTFRDQWRATTVKNNGIIHISSKLKGEMGERPNNNDLTVTSTGTTTVTVGFTTIVRRNKTTSLTRDPEDPRFGFLGISGAVTVTPGSVNDIFVANALNGGSASLLVNGGGTPVDFTVDADIGKDIFIQEIRFYGGGNGLKFGQFLSKSGGGLSNGVEVTIKSDNETVTLPLLKKTEDFKNKFAFGPAGGGQFRIDIQSGTDQFLASWTFETPFPIRAVGSFATDDFIQIRIQDNISSGVQEFEFICRGFERSI